MAFKFIALFALVAVVSALPQYHNDYHHNDYHHNDYHHVPVVKTVVAPVIKKVVHEEHHAPAPYSFEYSVHDEHTGDIKQQQEHSDGHGVHGFYSLIDADGHKRTVEYSDDGHSGFNAVVHREPVGHHHQPQQVHKIVKVQPVVQKYVAPVVTKVVQPVAHHSYAPVQHSYSHAPVQHSYSHAPAYHHNDATHVSTVKVSGHASNYHY